MAVIEAQSISKNYPTRSGTLSVLQDCSLVLDVGQSAAIIGPSGSGKSTLLHILGTLERPSGGNLMVEGRDPFQLSEPELAAFRNQRIGFVFQDHHLLPQCSVLENVLVPTFVSANGRSLEQRARNLIDRVGLSNRLDHLPSELSGGERQRASVARALIHQPAVVLADELTGNLDRRSADSIGELLLELPKEEKVVLIVVTHSVILAERFERRFEVNDGRLEAVK